MCREFIRMRLYCYFLYFMAQNNNLFENKNILNAIYGKTYKNTEL